MRLTDPELRVLGSLIEKEFTTPEYYPLTFNGLRTACNQSSNRDPVVDYSDDTVRDAVTSLREKGLVKQVRIPGQRSEKVRHSVTDHLPVSAPQTALLGVLVLRGPQTVGELRQRTERYVTFDSLVAVEEELTQMTGFDDPIVRRLERRPGQKEARYMHLLGIADGIAPEAESTVREKTEVKPEPTSVAADAPSVADLARQLEELRAEVAWLRTRIES
ncbi:MAG: YceH family protein [Acidimicrobiia bacterium]|nr:YceH family protein [Acidimicrobiia bacterium]